MKHILTLAAALLAAPAFAQTAIDQTKALAGNVSAGDAPGFPVTLAQPGHYKLTGHLSAPAQTTAIVISADNVTLDLNGYTVSGPGSCTQDSATRLVTCTQGIDNTKPGIAVQGARAAVRNGVVMGFSGAGLVAGEMGRYDNLVLAQNGQQGFTTVGVGNRIAHSTFDTNRGHGVYMTRGQVSASLAIYNGAVGMAGLSDSLLVTASQSLYNHGSFEFAVLRGTQANGNKTTRYGVTSLGANLEGSTAY